MELLNGESSKIIVFSTMLLDVEDSLFVKFGRAFLNEVNFHTVNCFEHIFTCSVFNRLFVVNILNSKL